MRLQFVRVTQIQFCWFHMDLQYFNTADAYVTGRFLQQQNICLLQSLESVFVTFILKTTSCLYFSANTNKRHHHCVTFWRGNIRNIIRFD